jgi:hypothetical protein
MRKYRYSKELMRVGNRPTVEPGSSLTHQIRSSAVTIKQDMALYSTVRHYDAPDKPQLQNSEAARAVCVGLLRTGAKPHEAKHTKKYTEQNRLQMDGTALGYCPTAESGIGN